MDFNIELSNGQVLKGIIKSPGENARAVIVFIHGIGEHAGRYEYWSNLFIQENMAFASIDLPGHGRSDGRRGHIRSSALIDEMIDILLKTASRTFPGSPVYLYGHSMGGGLVLDYVVRKNPKIRAVIVTSPWLKLVLEPSKAKVQLALLARFILPSLVQPSGLDTSQLSHDIKVIEAYNADPLVHNKISVSLFNIARKAAANALERAPELAIPTIIVHGSDDLICSPEGSKEFASKSALVDLKIWDGGFHELHNEPFKLEVFKHIMNAIKNSKPSR